MDAVIDRLVSDGKLSKNASQTEISDALKAYGRNTGLLSSNSKYEKRREEIINTKTGEALKNSTFNGNKFGQNKSGKLDPAIAASYGNAKKTVKVLVVLAEFPDLLHNTIPQPPYATKTYWVKDFSKLHYGNLLFGSGLPAGQGYYTTPADPDSSFAIKSPTFKQYFKEQSNGNLNVEGKVLDWVKVSKNAAYYGGDSSDGSVNDVNVRDFIIEAVQAAVEKEITANSAFATEIMDYDKEDPYDLDNDGDLMEPDGIIDHLMVIHSGMGQEEGAPDTAIWSHSSSMEALVAIGTTGVKFNAYTTEPENDAVGVFAHEFVHDLGMPDDYDTAYSGDGDIVEYWSIMSSGSWSGRPGGTMPTGINPWSRFKLGAIHGGSWINTEKTTLGEIMAGSYKQLDTASMNTGNTQSLIIELPSEDNFLVVNKPATGLKEFFGGRKSDSSNTLATPEFDLTSKTNVRLQYDIW